MDFPNYKGGVVPNIRILPYYSMEKGTEEASERDS